MSQPGKQPNKPTGRSFSVWESHPENLLFWGWPVLALLASLVIFILELAANPGGTWPGLLRAGVALLALGFTFGGDILSAYDRLKPGTWEKLGLLVALVVTLTAFFTGPEFNILLAPLLVGLARRREWPVVLLVGLGAIVVSWLEMAVFIGLGWPAIPDSAGVNLVALTALAFSLATFLKSHSSQVRHFQAEADRQASEMEVAHEIQTSLMPPPSFDKGNWKIAARSLPAKNVGGDFYEYVYHPDLDQTISGIAIGDVAGKGIPAALQMAVVRTLFRVEARRKIFPAETLHSVNIALQAERSFGMVTMCYAMLEPGHNLLRLANAGHNYPLLVNDKKNTLEEIGLPGLPLGIDDSIEYDEIVVHLEPGDSFIFYTDGVPEAMDREGNLYTFERFKDAVQANRQLNPQEMVDKVLAEISRFTQGAPQSDDITILVLQYYPQTGKISYSDLVAGPVRFNS